jgi:hypothetical protein
VSDLCADACAPHAHAQAMEREIEAAGRLAIDAAAAAGCLRRDMVCHACRAPIASVAKLKAHLKDCQAARGSGPHAAAPCGGGTNVVKSSGPPHRR